MTRYVLVVGDSHPLLLAGLPAHYCCFIQHRWCRAKAQAAWCAVRPAAIRSSAPYCAARLRRYRVNHSAEPTCLGQATYHEPWAYANEGEGIKVTGTTKADVRGKAIGFHFCPECGCVAHWRALVAGGDGRRRIAVNLRLTEPGPIAQVPIDHFDGLDKFEDLPRDGRCVSDYWF